MTNTVSPLSTIFCNTAINLFTSSLCNPVVGSSRIYNVFPVERFCNSDASFTLWASPPESVVALCPSLI